MSSTTTAPFKCNACGMTFNTQQDLMRHNRQAHPGESTTQMK
ncbi:MAG: hypothetical protein E6K88_08540 [Thaumarchaeota archaeon]|nr:MAG: hypothetical protein E6K88_08540 [Nitrososphaerota archaeon]TLY10875.1 MAG: hypothetical protein E6K85_02675 [Nitrososphaerota archaeon]